MKNTRYIYGVHAVESLLQFNPQRVMQLLVTKDRSDQKIQNILSLAESLACEIQLVSREILNQKVQSDRHQGVAAMCHPLKQLTENDLPNFLQRINDPVFLLVLDGVQDPHNLGACLRTADAAGVHAVIAPKDRSVGLNDTVAKVASGAAETVPFIQVTNLARTLDFLKENAIWIYGASAEAKKTVYQEKLTGSIALVLGAEGAGLRRLTEDKCDGLLSIPMQGTVSSLNVSVSAGIFLFEAVRQRGG